MASALNKRQQARNERALQDLIKSVPGNNVCADCGARNPGWASWSLGIFMCMRCATLHRKLGTHLSKVKSLSMDKWDNAQVDNMKRVGNVESNKLYNPRNVKPQMPIDIDEVESAMERFIRQKYETRVFMNDSRPGTRSNTGSSSSVEDRPPPLPPKPTKRFGFGIQKSSTYPKQVTPPVSPGLGGFNSQDPSPPRVNKPSRIFGSNIHTSGDGLDSKLTTLRDMGFRDDKRNSTVLKGLNGNLDRAVEALIRLGEQNPEKSRGNTPTPPAKPNNNGLTFDRTQTAPAATSSTNPFDALDAVAPLPQPQPQAPLNQTQQLPYGGSATQPTSPTNPYNSFLPQGQAVQYQPQAFEPQQSIAQQHNPFLQQQQQQSLEQSLQGLQLSNQQPQPSLFPNRTGGYQQPQPFVQTNPFNQSFTPPPMPQIPQQYASFYQPQQQQSLSSPTSSGNPFLKSTRSQMFTPTNFANSNPYGQLPAQAQPQQQQAPNPFMMQQHHQSQPQPQVPQQQASNPFMTQQQQTSTAQAPNSSQAQQNPYQQSNHQQPNYQQSNYQQPNYQQPSYQQQPRGAFDKNSILSLYNYPQLAPQHAQQSQTPPAPILASAPALAPAVPGPGNMNPFAAAQGPQTGQQPSALSVQAPGVRHVSNESVDFAGLMGGRHSPDAFTGLSSSFRR